MESGGLIETLARPFAKPISSSEPAVVFGLCVHGLATARSLSRRGVDVHALENNHSNPGSHTRLATVHWVSELNNAGLIDELLTVSGRFWRENRPVLFPMNDNMVRILAQHWDRLDPYYRLPWSPVRQTVESLLSKSQIERRCREAGLRYPESQQVNGSADVEESEFSIPYPAIAKPIKPLSQFKALLVESNNDLRHLTEKYSESLPFLVQRWIPGNDRSLVFGALVLDRGEMIARFEGRKLMSHPQAMGQTTAACSARDAEVHEATTRFFSGMGLSGPVSLEFKRDDQGRLWVIEPTVGRTDFWVGCCIANGVDIPYLNYLVATGQQPREASQTDHAIWCDTARDPMVYFKLLRQFPRHVLTRRLSPALTAARDMAPALHAAISLGRRLGSRFGHGPHDAP